MTPTDIVVVGSLNVDLVARVARLLRPGETVQSRGFERHPGGKGANQAVAAARLGASVRMIGKVGRDAEGDMLLRSLRDAGVQTDAVSTADTTTGMALITTDDAGENSIVIIPGANATLLPGDLDAMRGLIAGARLVLTQLEVPMETVERLGAICCEENVPLMLDPAPAVPLPASLLRCITWLTPNESEAELLLGGGSSSLDEAGRAGRLLRMGSRNVVLKLGSRGVYLAGEASSPFAVGAPSVQAVDTTAAGDVFNGAFAARLVAGESPSRSAEYAVTAAALSVTREGAQPSMPDAAEVEALLARAQRQS